MPIRRRTYPDNPRTSMEPDDEPLEPDEMRQFITDIVNGIHTRGNRLARERDGRMQSSPGPIDVAREHYGKDVVLFLNGIAAGHDAMEYGNPDGSDVRELKERYSGKFVEGVEIGERLGVYQGTEFEFTSPEEPDNENFTFTNYDE